jgi:SH3-like domain-containing protein
MIKFSMNHKADICSMWIGLKKQGLFLLLLFFTTARSAELITTSRVNLREGPGTQYAIIGLVESQTRLPLLGELDDWLKVRLDSGMVGWLHSKYADRLPEAKSWTVLRVLNPGNLRLGPGAEFPVVANIEQNSGLVQLADSGDWFQVGFDSAAVGWVNRKLVEEWGKLGNPISVLIVAERSNFRAAPNLDSEILAKLDEGQQLILLSKEGDWNLVYCEPELVGFVHDIVVKPLFLSIHPVPCQLIAKSGNLRLGPSLNYQVLQLLSPDTPVYTLRQYLDWYEVITPAGKRGWVHQVLFGDTGCQAAGWKPFYPDSISLAINAFEIAEQYRKAKSYEQTIRQYVHASELLGALYQRHSSDERLALNYAQCLYAFAQGLFDDQDKNIAEANRILKNISRQSNYYQQAEQILNGWKQAVARRAELFNIFAGEVKDLQRILNEFSQQISNYPLTTEAEIKRLVGRYFYVDQQAAETALPWQKESIAIYHTMYVMKLPLNSYNLDHYFRALIELSVSYANLSRYKESMKALDEANVLLEAAENPQWEEYYKRTVNSLTKQLH